MDSRALRKLLLSSVALGVLLAASEMISSSAMAAQAADSKPAAEGLEEIMVTATRRVTNNQSTPISVTAMDASLIEQTSPRDIGDLAGFVPNFSVAKVPAQGLAAFAMRGAGSVTSIVYFEQPIAVVVDDFVIPSIQTQLFDPFDVEQIEVLRGPQGTLFGKNTTGGVIVVRTKKPNLDNVEFNTVDGFGDFGTWYAKFAINLPLIPGKLALRATMAHDNSKGYMKNGAFYGPINMPGTPWDGLSGRGPGNRFGGQDVTNGRIKMLYKPSSRFDALLQYEFLVNNSESEDSINNTIPGGELFNILGFPGQNCSDPLNCGGSDGVMSKPHTGVHGGYLTMNANFDIGTLTSMTGYRWQLTENRMDTTGQPTVIGTNGEKLGLFDLIRADVRKTWQQEVRFASNFSGPFNFVAGVFYQHDTIDFTVLQHLGFAGLNIPFILSSAQQAESEAAYLESTYKFTNDLSLTAGVRYTRDKKNWQGRQQAFATGITGDPSTPANFFDEDPIAASDFSKYPAGVISLDKSWKVPTYRASLNYQVTPDIFTYFTFSHGYKAGGYSDQAGGGGVFGNDLVAFAQAAQPTNPEKSNSFELGVKSQFFDNRLRANLTAFLVKYSDLQEQLNIPLTVMGHPQQQTVFLNAASAKVKGLEAEITARPVPALTLRAVGSYQDGKYSSFPAPGAGYDLASAPLPRTPKFQWTLDATYKQSVADWAVVTLNGNMNYVGSNLFQQSITDAKYNGYLNARTLVNASITLADPDEKMYARVIGRNLTDKRYLTGNYPIPGLWGFANYGPPRYFGFEIGYHL